MNKILPPCRVLSITLAHTVYKTTFAGEIPYFLWLNLSSSLVESSILGGTIWLFNIAMENHHF